MNWDRYFHSICSAVALKSPCLSRKIGAILVKDNSIISTGFNGPPRGVPHCGSERNSFEKTEFPSDICPRKFLGYKTGEGLELCPAVHAEMNAVIDAARKGASTIGSTLYMNCLVCCKQCMGILINAGIREIVVENVEHYDSLVSFLSISTQYPKVRQFNLS